MLSEEIVPLDDIENIARRHFVMGLGATLLAGCGGDGDNAVTDGERTSANNSAQASGVAPTSDGIDAGATSAGTAQTRTFTHPGLLHTEADFERMRTKVGAHASPWIDSWNVLVANGHTRLTNEPNPQVGIYRGNDPTHGQNYGALYNDIAAAYGDALRWKVSDDTRYADKAVEYLDQWAAKLTTLGGSDVALAAGIYGYEFANAAEIMRGYSGWSPAGLAAFQAMMRNVFYPVSHAFLTRIDTAMDTHYWANWGLANVACVLAIGVLCDDAELVNEAITHFRTGGSNGCIRQAVYYMHPGNLGQWQEAGRDQGHSTLGIALTGAICEMAWNQGIDLYGYDNNRFLAGAEYVAKANLKQADGAFYTMPFVTYQNSAGVIQTQFAAGGQGDALGRPCWALVANHYINRKGLAAPYTKRAAELVAPEGGGGNYGPNSGGFDQLGYGTLTCTLDPGTPAATPTGLTGYASAGKVVLSWWGSSNAISYNVKRATIAGGPYSTIRSGITDLLTYTDMPAGAGTYFYVVTAQTITGESALSNEVKVITAQQLLAHLAFDEGGGITAADRSGNGRNGTLNGATWAVGRSGSAVSLNGSGAYVALPDDLLVDVSDFTIASWVFWNGSQTWARLFDFGTGFHRYMMFTPRGRLRNGWAGMRFAMTANGPGDGPPEQIIDAPTELPSKRWVHVAVTLSGSTGTMYVDGTPVSTNTAMFQAPFRLGSTTQNWLGKSQYSADATFNGLIDDFRIYRGALSAAQIASLMAN
ncbi:LamG-like jellyroll fold domain-containing protein [Burkholderia sp. MSHR3999]|uniref:LamG-like jellyroll fold domain-containing protein n=1 Tax=Burkholderia sp. MSHR3999 TaxID=1542965 RepID=UPI0005ABCA77|nr:LamG-like jellyroll fold domain-containing protein [Burkholderia sp. MSHR3999]